MLESILDQLNIFWDLYKNYIVIIGFSGLVAFIFTPISGVIAEKLGAVDKPSFLREKTDSTRDRRIHEKIMPRLGGLAIVIALFAGLIFAAVNDRVGLNQKELIHVMLGVGLIAALGFWDSVSDVNPKTQIMVQVVAALIITLAGIRIDFIEILKININFDIVTYNFNLLGMHLSVSPLADLVTIFWIVGIVNAINWVAGIDGLAGSMSLFSAVTLLFIGVKYENVVEAVLAAALAGAILGFLPFNLPPAKTFNGSIGDMVMGYLLGVLAIISGAKLSTSIILLAIPILDAVWVLAGRLTRHYNSIHSPLDLLKISDKTHLHHRLMALGFTPRQTLGIEMLAFLMFCIAAYYFAGFSNETLMMLILLAVCLAIFIFLSSSLTKRQRRKLQQQDEKKPPQKVVIEEDTPEQRYAY